MTFYASLAGSMEGRDSQDDKGLILGTRPVSTELKFSVGGRDRVFGNVLERNEKEWREQEP